MEKASLCIFPQATATGPYAVATSGGLNLTHSCAEELAISNIRVNGISPGPIPTEDVLKYLYLEEKDIPKLGKRFNILLERVGTPRHCASRRLR